MIQFAITIAALSYAFIVFVFSAPGSMAEELPQVSRVEPNSIPIGHASEVRVVGQFKSWPVQVWSSNPHVTWSCKPESGVFQVSVDSSADLKEAWFRLYSSVGTTPPKRILIAPVSPIQEKEPNDQPSRANEIKTEEHVSAALEKNVDVDCFQVRLDQGDQFSVVVDSHRYGSPVDANLQLLDEKGFVVVESIDHYGLDPAICATITRSGIYYIKVFAFPAEPDSTISFRGGAEWWYRLRCRKGPLQYELPPAREATLVECTLRDAAASLTLDTALSLNLQDKVFQIVRASKENAGKLSSQNHYYKLPKVPGVQVRLEVTAQSMGSPLDPTLTIIDSSAKQHAYQDDSGNDRDVSLTWRIPDDKDYFAVIGDFHRLGGDGDGYWLSLVQVHPSVRITTTSDSYSNKVNQEIEIGIKLEKPADWIGELEFFCTDPSIEINFNPNSIKIEKGTKEFSIKLKGAKAYSGVLPLQIKHKESETALSLSGPLHENIVPWLTITE